MWWNSSKALKCWSVSHGLFTKISSTNPFTIQILLNNPQFSNQFVFSQKKPRGKLRRWQHWDKHCASRRARIRQISILLVQNGGKPQAVETTNFITYFNRSLEIHWDENLNKTLHHFFFNKITNQNHNNVFTSRSRSDIDRDSYTLWCDKCK